MNDLNLRLTNVDKKAEVDIRKWADIVIEKWQYNLARYKLRDSGSLLNSFQAHITREAGGNDVLITFTFKYYLRMLDMGVGKGTRIADVGENKLSRRLEGKRTGNRRQQYPVYSKTLYSQIYTLSELLAKQYATQAGQVIVNEFSHGGDADTVFDL